MTPRLTLRSMRFDEIDPNATSTRSNSLPHAAYRRTVMRQRTAAEPAAATHSAMVYYRNPTSPRLPRVPGTLSLGDGRLTLTDLDGSVQLLSCPTADVRRVIIDHATLHVRLRNGDKVAASLYPMGSSRRTGQSARVLYLATFVNGWANIRDQRLAGWKRALRANGIKVSDRNVQLIPPITLMLAAFVAAVVLTAVIQIVDAL
jgi:hypothetical protein